jgi:hypothetical protein
MRLSAGPRLNHAEQKAGSALDGSSDRLANRFLFAFPAFARQVFSLCNDVEDALA